MTPACAPARSRYPRGAVPGPPSRFAYYQRLSSRDRATYRKSDAVVTLAVPDAGALLAALATIEHGLAADDRRRTGAGARALAAGLCTQLGATPVVVRVLAHRPSDRSGELHGLYERDEDGSAVIRVWMRTAAHHRPVAYRSFVRTLLHELCHHFDFELLRLRDTFHTEGFFRREAALARALLPAQQRRAVPREPPPSRQLGLFDG